jgi:hypothetical protein
MFARQSCRVIEQLVKREALVRVIAASKLEQAIAWHVGERFLNATDNARRT